MVSVYFIDFPAVGWNTCNSLVLLLCFILLLSCSSVHCPVSVNTVLCFKACKHGMWFSLLCSLLLSYFVPYIRINSPQIYLANSSQRSMLEYNAYHILSIKPLSHFITQIPSLNWNISVDPRLRVLCSRPLQLCQLFFSSLNKERIGESSSGRNACFGFSFGGCRFIMVGGHCATAQLGAVGAAGK